MASGRDITACTSPAPVPWVVWVFSHALVIVTFTPLPNKIVDCFQIARRGLLSDWPSLSTWTTPLAAFKFQPFLDRFQDSNWPSLTTWTTPLAAFQVSAFSSRRLLHSNFRIAYPLFSHFLVHRRPSFTATSEFPAGPAQVGAWTASGSCHVDIRCTNMFCF
jgi:hypothetical protein